jgi:heterogeneous nuclear ribonucleoprotein A1/A3
VISKFVQFFRSRGFGFVTFTNADHVDAVQRARPHRVDGRVVETKRAMPRMETTNLPSKNSTSEGSNNRLFIGGLPQVITKDHVVYSYKNLN